MQFITEFCAGQRKGGGRELTALVLGNLLAETQSGWTGWGRDVIRRIRQRS
jgi:hypothetical protein